MKKIKQVILYEVEGNLYKSFTEAESAIVDMFGKHVDGICMEIEKETGRNIRFTPIVLKLVEKMWRDREILSDYLGMIYQESQELAELADLRNEE